MIINHPLTDLDIKHLRIKLKLISLSKFRILGDLRTSLLILCPSVTTFVTSAMLWSPAGVNTFMSHSLAPPHHLQQANGQQTKVPVEKPLTAIMFQQWLVLITQVQSETQPESKTC